MWGMRAKMDLHETWKDIRSLIVNELFTMTGKHFAAIEQQLFLTMRDCGRTPDSSHSLFGGIGVVLTGDRHENRPVHGAPLFQGSGDIRSGTAADAAGRAAANAQHDCPGWDTQFVSNARGLHILGQLHTTVLLQTQFIMDPDLSALNARQRGGRLTDADFDGINECAIGAPEKPASIHHPNLRNAHFMVLRHTLGDVIVRALLPRRAAEDQQQLIGWSTKDGMRTVRDDAWAPVTDRCLRVLLGRLTQNKTGDVPSVMYFYNGMPYTFRHSVNIDFFYFKNNGATAVALLLDDAIARHPSPDAPVVTCRKTWWCVRTLSASLCTAFVTTFRTAMLQYCPQLFTSRCAS
jgi:hypothetical protein